MEEKKKRYDLALLLDWVGRIVIGQRHTEEGEERMRSSWKPASISYATVLVCALFNIR